MDSKTIPQIAKELNTNRYVVYRIANKLNIKPTALDRTENEGAHRTANKYGSEAIDLIKAEFERMNSERADSKGQAESPEDQKKAAEPSRADKDGSDQTEKEAKITILEERISLKDELIAEKDKRIAELKAEIEKDSRMIEDLQKTIQDQAAALLKAQENMQGKILLEAAAKPSLIARIKSHFSKTTPPAEG